MKPIGFFGGTFDPIHLGHLRMAIEVMETFALESLTLLPNKVPPHRPQPIASAEQRLTMTQLAVKDIAGLTVDDLELKRDGDSYTVDTLEHLARKFPGRPLLFMMGMDSLLSFTAWHGWQRILQLASLAVCCRPGHRLEPDALDAQLSTRLSTGPIIGPGQIVPLTTTELAISATDIRTRVKNGQRLDFLLPRAVVEYIQTSGLYRADSASC
ncbi:nicotinate-nucleotide adenylyltransferase [Gallaecimonas mangrovi]|uniref:nicotinate-nucleotide adenylyltransferase n=1 Tax=Gallaecimonas mangrovi TaxID=2291597 RepID=UPI000E20B20C|nr:nicotinate-nucleotide adenylyltransferase [Gallaecimonas mangrovi]